MLELSAVLLPVLATLSNHEAYSDGPKLARTVEASLHGHFDKSERETEIAKGQY